LMDKKKKNQRFIYGFAAVNPITGAHNTNLYFDLCIIKTPLKRILFKGWQI
jgi:predicted Co/Zn/Cd cation transporter (cation efflux family)